MQIQMLKFVYLVFNNDVKHIRDYKKKLLNWFDFDIFYWCNHIYLLIIFNYCHIIKSVVKMNFMILDAIINEK